MTPTPAPRCPYCGGTPETGTCDMCKWLKQVTEMIVLAGTDTGPAVH